MRSAKQLKALVSPKPKRIVPNVERQAANFARQYHSVERVEFVKARPCAACGDRRSENAHLLGNDGAGRKGPYTEIGPLCGPDYSSYIGCHALYDEYRSEFNKQYPGFNPVAVAANTERDWQSHVTEHGANE